MSDLQTVVMQMPRMAGTPATYTSQVSEGGVKQMTSCCRITPQIAIMAARVTVIVSVISISIIGVTRAGNKSLFAKFEVLPSRSKCRHQMYLYHFSYCRTVTADMKL